MKAHFSRAVTVRFFFTVVFTSAIATAESPPAPAPSFSGNTQPNNSPMMASGGPSAPIQSISGNAGPNDVDCPTCNTATVNCLGSDELIKVCGSAGGCTKRKICTVYLPTNVCRIYNISDSGNKHTLPLKGDCSKVPVDQVSACCTEQHEERHLKQACGSLACDEGDAYSAQSACETAAMKGRNPNTATLEKFCLDFATNFLVSKWTSCMCSRSKKNDPPRIDEDDCNYCYNGCRNAGLTLPAPCDKIKLEDVPPGNKRTDRICYGAACSPVGCQALADDLDTAPAAPSFKDIPLFDPLIENEDPSSYCSPMPVSPVPPTNPVSPVPAPINGQ